MELNTKKDFERLLLGILEPLKDKYTPGCAFLELGGAYAWYENISAKMESFARPLWGLVPYWAGGGKASEFRRIYANGIASGTDPDGSEYWGVCHDGDQRFVEMAALAYGLLLTPERLWDPLNDREKDNFAKWLYSINGHDMPMNNWRFFRILVNTALKKLGREYSAEMIEKDFGSVESFYLGNGWYRDGVKGQKDYYIAFAIHFYSLIYAAVMKNEDPVRAKLFKERAAEFAKEYIYWFSDTGAAVPYGRSLTYRFAQLSFWSACVLAEVYPFPISVMKGIIVRGLSYWFEDNDIFDNGHILTVGYRYGQQNMAENYNAPGSPYWGLKVFAFMALPSEHEFWTAKAAPMPPLEDIKKLEKADMIAARYRGAATLYPAGTLDDFSCGHTRYKYLKFAYSSVFGFSVPKSSLEFLESAPDSTLSFEIDRRIFTRIRNYGFTLSDNKIITKWSPFIGIDVETEIVPTEYGHIRKHTVTSDYDCIAYDAGFAVSCADEDMCERKQEAHSASVKNRFSKCSVQSDTGEGMVCDTVPNTCLMYSKASIPAIKYEIKKGKSTFKTYIYAC